MPLAKSSKSKQPALLPANVPGIVRELHHLAAVSNATMPSQKPHKDGGRLLVVEGQVIKSSSARCRRI